MNGTTAVTVTAVGSNPGPSWEVKGSGDFNGDGKSDIVWWHAGDLADERHQRAVHQRGRLVQPGIGLGIDRLT
jgi:hypothetical protein